jgi:hypothetical protein
MAIPKTAHGVLQRGKGSKFWNNKERFCQFNGKTGLSSKAS